MEKTTEELEVIYGPDNSENDANSSIWSSLEKFYLNVCYYTLAFFIFFGAIIFLCCCKNPAFWPFAVIYIGWLYYDRETPHNRGRKFEWLGKLKLWKVGRDYFPVSMVKTAELPPDKNYLFAAFPHGILCYGVGHSIITNPNNFDKAYPGLNVRVVTLNVNFNFPIVRELLLALGGCASSERSITNILNGPPGSVGVLIVGGVAEALKSKPGTYNIVLKNRKGFVRVALKSGASLVPVFSFGETYTFNQPKTKFYTKLQQKLRSSIHFPLIVLKGRGLFQDYLGILPYKHPITTVVGKPIALPKVEDPPEELINEYHQKFIVELMELFDKYKGKYDVSGTNAELVIE